MKNKYPKIKENLWANLFRMQVQCQYALKFIKIELEKSIRLEFLVLAARHQNCFDKSLPLQCSNQQNVLVTT